jgi:hypothetical protein
MKQKFLFLMMICGFVGSIALQASNSDFDDTPVLILFTASPAQLASISPLDRIAYKSMVGELIAFQYRVHDKLLSSEELPFVLKKIHTNSLLTLFDRESQKKFDEHLKSVAGWHKIKFEI